MADSDLRISEPLPPDDGQWLRTLRAEVQPTTFKKGREYAEARRVTLLTRHDGALTARVIGSSGERYQVEVRPGEGKVDSSCSCPSWNKYGPHCKHVVAAALVYLARSRPPAVAEAASPAALSEVISLPALAKLENWLGLSSLPDYEFLYRLTAVTAGPGTRHWVMDVRRQDAQAKGPVHVKRLLTAGTRIAPADERVFLELARHESRYDARIILSDDDLVDLIGLLRQRKVIYRGTPLAFSEVPARPQIRLESRPDGAQARIDILLPDGLSLPMKEVAVLAGRRTFVLAGQALYPLEPDFPPRLLRKWLLEPSMSFPASQLDRVLSFFAAHLPRFQMTLKADGLEVEEAVAPKFLLTIEGSPERIRAQLAARYGQTTVPVSPIAQHLGYAGGVRTAAAPNDGAPPSEQALGSPAPSSDGTEATRRAARMLYRRQDDAERAAGKLLLDQGFRFDPASQSYEATGDRAVDFWARGRQELPPDWELFGAAHKVRVRPRVRPKIRVTMSAVNWFELDAEFVTDDQAVDLGAVRMWLQSGRRFIPLKDGTFAEADAAELKRAADLLEEAGALPGTRKSRVPLYLAPAIDLLSTLGETAEVEAKAKKAIASLRDLGGIPAVKPPKGLIATLRHYQEGGLAWLWFLHRNGLSGILADDMGLGKTVQALALLQKVKNEEGQKPSLVVAPTSVLANWEREAERFTPGISCVIWHGQDRREHADQLEHTDLVLTSYALVRRDVEELSKVPFRYVILDEAQNIKNAGSATAQACKTLPALQRLALTGTPLENRLSELWSIFDFLMPGFLGTADTFSDRYEQPIQVAADAEVRERLRRRIHPFVMRRLKQEVAKDLPPKTESIAWCEMEPGQAALYREVLEDSRRKVFDTIGKLGFGRSRVSILAALMRLRQVCCDPRLLKLPPGTALPPSAKLERAGALMNDLIAEGHRALVFSQFTEMLSLLKEQADAAHFPYLYLDGRTRDRMAKVDEFNDEKGPPLFFISLKAGGTGLNLTAADYVLHYDPWWNPAVEDQATDRTHRIGQTKAVIAYKLITRGTVEEKILALQKRKRDLAAGVLGSGADLGKTLSEADVEELFRPD